MTDQPRGKLPEDAPELEWSFVFINTASSGKEYVVRKHAERRIHELATSASELAGRLMAQLAAAEARAEGDARRLQLVLDKVAVTELEWWIGKGIGDWERVPTLDEFRAAIDAVIDSAQEAERG